MSSPSIARFAARAALLRLVPGVVLATSLGLFSAVVAADGPLTIEAAQRLAVARSRQLSAQDMAVAASREMAVAAGQLPDPVLKLGIDNLPASGPDQFNVTRDFMTMRRIGVMQEITRSDKRHWRTERYARAAEKSVAEKAATLATIQRDTALAWLDRYYAEEMAAVIAEQATQARFEMQAAEGAYRGGRGNQAEIFVARGALVAVDDRASEIGRRVLNAKTMLSRWTGGDVTNVPLAGKPEIDTLRLDVNSPAALETPLETQLAHHPQIVVLTGQTAIAEAEAKLAEAARKADWSVEVAYQQRGPAFPNMLSFGVSLPLQWDQSRRQDRELAAKLALVEQAVAERDEMLRGHVAEVRAMLQEWENNRERSARYTRELIPLASDRTQATVAAYRGAKASLAELLAARRNEIDVRLQALQLRWDTARLWAQLNFLLPANEMASPVTLSKESK